jgi:uncharacterized membrane protein YdbT with pleckstrin-like domain
MAEEQNLAPDAPPPLAGVSKNRKEDMLEPGENVLRVVRRSSVGLAGIYIVAIIAAAAIVTLVITISPSTFEASGSQESGSLTAIFGIAALLLVLILFTVTYIYRQSKLLVTDRSLVQIMQKTLFIRKVSRLSMSNVEDVSEEQRGLLASIFNFGTLTVQTAGARDNFVFSLCPNPTALADRIIEARQAYAKSVEENSEAR